MKISNLWKNATSWEKLTVILAGIYVISPIDIMPEAILGPLGLVDDLGALVLIVRTLMGIGKREVTETTYEDVTEKDNTKKGAASSQGQVQSPVKF
jgi:uncharacterized membrane protein YkvA (DUF1232 family)